MGAPDSNHFPPEVRLLLQRAADTPNTPSDPMARLKAINAASERARLMFPQLFREHSDETCRSE